MTNNHFDLTLSDNELPADPLELFEGWYRAAEAAEESFPEAMALATSNRQGMPSVRMVLVKGFDRQGLRFYTNYDSPKAQDLLANPQASVLFYWASLNRQVRIAGSVTKLTDAESDAYFHSRPRGSQIGAWVSSRQSAVIPGRHWLDDRYRALQRQHDRQLIPRPEYWGGFRLLPRLWEFWQSGSHRLHDRFRYSYIVEEDAWRIERLSP